MNKKYAYVLCFILICSSVLFANVQALVLAHPVFAVCKYISSVSAIIYTSKLLLDLLQLPKINHEVGKRICIYVSTFIFLCYCILTVDTFIFHALTWYPGILRYAMFNAFGPLYLIFILPGILWYLGSEDSV